MKWIGIKTRKTYELIDIWYTKCWKKEYDKHNTQRMAKKNGMKIQEKKIITYDWERP